MDLLLFESLEELWAGGFRKGLAADTLSLGESCHAHQTRLPTRFELVGNLVETRVACARTADAGGGRARSGGCRSCSDSLVGNGVLLGPIYHYTLRTTELLTVRWPALSVDDLAVSAVALPMSKTGAVRGAQEVVSIDDKVVGGVVHVGFTTRGGDGDLALAGSPNSFRICLAPLCTRLACQYLVSARAACAEAVQRRTSWSMATLQERSGEAAGAIHVQREYTWFTDWRGGSSRTFQIRSAPP